MRVRKKAEPTKDSASATSASGAFTTSMSAPARAGPPTLESDRLPLRSEFASRYCSRFATATNSVFHAMSKMTDRVPTMKKIANSRGMLSMSR